MDPGEFYFSGKTPNFTPFRDVGSMTFGDPSQVEGHIVWFRFDEVSFFSFSGSAVSF